MDRDSSENGLESTIHDSEIELNPRGESCLDSESGSEAEQKQKHDLSTKSKSTSSATSHSSTGSSSTDSVSGSSNDRCSSSDSSSSGSETGSTEREILSAIKRLARKKRKKPKNAKWEKKILDTAELFPDVAITDLSPSKSEDKPEPSNNRTGIEQREDQQNNMASHKSGGIVNSVNKPGTDSLVRSEPNSMTGQGTGTAQITSGTKSPLNDESGTGSGTVSDSHGRSVTVDNQPKQQENKVIAEEKTTSEEGIVYVATVTKTGVGKKDSEFVKNLAEELELKDKAENLRNMLDKESLAHYNKAKGRSIRKTFVPPLAGEVEPDPVQKMTDFFGTADGRLARCNLFTNRNEDQNFTITFDRKSGDCITCPHENHKVFQHGREQLQSQVYMLTDQNYPPLTQSTDTGNCISTVRVEYGGCNKIADRFLSLVEEQQASIPDGSHIMIGSITELARVGLAGYLRSVRTAITKLRSKLGQTNYLYHAPVMWTAGTNDAGVATSLEELATWLSHGQRDIDDPISETNRATLRKIKEDGRGCRLTHAQRISLPDKLDFGFQEQPWQLGSRKVPTKILPLDAKGEGDILSTLSEELKSKFGVNLSKHWDCGKEIKRASQKQEKTILIVGGSQATDLAEAFKRKTQRTVKVCHFENWRSSDYGIQKMTEALRKEISAEVGLIVLQLLEVSAFCTANGAAVGELTRDLNSNKIHAQGEIHVIDKNKLVELNKRIKPILDLCKDREMALVLPLPKFVTAPCCPDPDHCTNGGYPEFFNQQLTELETLRRNQNDILHRAWQNKNVIISAHSVITGEEPEDIWQSDPTGPVDRINDRLAKHILNKAKDTNMIFKKYRPNHEAPDSKRQRGEDRYGSYSGRGTGSGNRRENSDYSSSQSYYYHSRGTEQKFRRGVDYQKDST